MSNKQVQGCFGCLFWLFILSGIFASCQYFLQNNPFKTPQTSVKTPIDDAEFRRLMRQGYKLSDQKNCQKALEFFQKALARRPQDTLALKAIANMKVCLATQTYYSSMNEGYRQLKSEKYAQALNSFTKALEQRPNDKTSLQAIKTIRYEKPMELSLQLLKAEDYPTALVVLQTILKQYPNDPQVMQVSKLAIGKTAVKYFQKQTPVSQVISKADSKSQFLPFAMFLSSQLAKTGATDEALLIAQRISHEHPEDQQARQLTLELARQTAKKYVQRATTAK